MTEYQKERLVYQLFAAAFVIELVVSALFHWDNIALLQPWQLLLIAFAAFRGGVALAEDKVFEWLREPYCHAEKDATGAGDSVKPNYNSGWRKALGEFLCCPICTGTHVGSILLTLCAFVPHVGIVLVYGLAAAGGLEILHSIKEFFFWNGRKARESCK